MRSVLFKIIGVSVLLVGSLIAPAFASSSTSRVDRIVQGGAEGDVVSLSSVDVESQYQGLTCVITVESQNNFSVHEGNTLTVSSGEGSFVVAVESEIDALVSESSELTLGETIDLSLTLGETGSSSLSVDVVQDCSGADAVVEEADVVEVVAEEVVVEADAVDEAAEASVEVCDGDVAADVADAADVATATDGPDDVCDTEVVVSSAGSAVAEEIPTAAPAKAVVGAPVYAG